MELQNTLRGVLVKSPKSASNDWIHKNKTNARYSPQRGRSTVIGCHEEAIQLANRMLLSDLDYVEAYEEIEIKLFEPAPVKKLKSS